MSVHDYITPPEIADRTLRTWFRTRQDNARVGGVQYYYLGNFEM